MNYDLIQGKTDEPIYEEEEYIQNEKIVYFPRENNQGKFILDIVEKKMAKKQKTKKKLAYRKELQRKRGIKIASQKKKRADKKRRIIDIDALKSESIEKNINPFIHLSSDEKN